MVVQSNFVVVIQTAMTLAFVQYVNVYDVSWILSRLVEYWGAVDYWIVMFLIDLMIPFCCCWRLMSLTGTLGLRRGKCSGRAVQPSLSYGPWVTPPLLSSPGRCLPATGRCRAAERQCLPGYAPNMLLASEDINWLSKNRTNGYARPVPNKPTVSVDVKQHFNQVTLGSIPLRLSFLFKSCGLWTRSCDFVPHN